MGTLIRFWQWGLACAVLVMAQNARGVADSTEYEVGGPLAGLKLPLYPTRHGEPAGHPGCIPGTEFASRRPGAEYELYPGSVEHWSCYWMKYVPARSEFDQQSMLKNWVAPAIPGAESAPAEKYASPVYWIPDNGQPRNTGRKDPPVPVIRCKTGGPVFELDLGDLNRGLYVVRVIGAVPTGQIQQFRRPLYIALRVNDGPKGETHTYRRRCNYVDEFYSVAEIYFHALERRRYTAELWLDHGTQVELLVHNITLDDVLAGTDRRPIKTKPMLVDEETINEAKTDFQNRAAAQKNIGRFRFDPATRLARDEMIWRYFPPDNAEGDRAYRVRSPARLAQNGIFFGAHGMSESEIEKQYGSWDPPFAKQNLLGHFFSFDPDARNSRDFLINSKLKLTYTIDDWMAQKPLPDPYPFKDDGAGLFEPDPHDSNKGMIFSPIADATGARWRQVALMVDGGARVWLATRNQDVARDAAVTLIRYAWALPTLDSSYYLAYMASGSTFGCKDTVRQREIGDYYLHHYEHYQMAIYAYDWLFDYIQGNEELARSVSRFVPWVKTSQDVIELLDTYLVQTTAKRCLRYFHTRAQRFPPVIAVLGDPKLTQPWSDFLFSKVFEYPFSLVGIQDMITSTFDRNGCNFIGSAFYTQAGGCRTLLEQMKAYLNTVAGSRYDLRDPVKYPKPLAHCYWRLNAQVAGLDLLRIGDVRGPDKVPSGRAETDQLGDAARSGWQWSAGDPRFAWILANVAGRAGETDGQWKAIQTAAATVPRAPWLDLPSRFIANWAGILETGLEHDDVRFRRAVYVRTGFGKGHEHADTLDLQVFAHGLPMTVDDGQRSGYCKPNSRLGLVHNIVEIDKGSHGGGFGVLNYAWVPELSDAPGARYLQARAISPVGHSRAFERQTALIDVDEGRGSKPLSIAQQKPGAALDPSVTTPNSYVFDVFRVSGGTTQTYLFHAMVNDDLQMNAQEVKPVELLKRKEEKQEKPVRESKEPKEGEDDEELAEPKREKAVKFNPRTDAEYLSRFSQSAGRLFVGKAPDVFEATWRYRRDGSTGSEQKMLRENYNEKSPRKYTRLTLFGVGGQKVLQADGACLQPGITYRYTELMIQRESERKKALESAWPALIEPYDGEPFLAERRLLGVANNEEDALRAVAVQVKTRNGHTDLCFADGRPDKKRTVEVPASSCQVAGSFAYYSTDANGLRACALTGGTLLDTPEVRLTLPQRERTAKIASVDYPARTLRIDQPWPAACGGRVFEVGLPGRWTAFTAATVTPESKGATFTLHETAEMYRAPIRDVNATDKTIRTGLEVMMAKPGFDENLVASNDDLTKFWHVSRMDGSHWQVRDGTVSLGDFQPSGALRMWEYGPGDTVRMACYAGLCRLDRNLYELRSDSEVRLRFPAVAAESSVDGSTWKPLAGSAQGIWLEVTVPVNASKDGMTRLRLR